MSCKTCGNTCKRFAEILGGVVTSSSDDLCVVQRLRNLRPTILGVPTRSPLVIAALFSFEPIDRDKKALNLGETVILQEEINPFIDVLRENDIIVTAVHNHWLFDNPRLFYIHFESIDKPLAFAEKVAEAFEVLKNESQPDFDNHSSDNDIDW
jgi:hypothetical protein